MAKIQSFGFRAPGVIFRCPSMVCFGFADECTNSCIGRTCRCVGALRDGVCCVQSHLGRRASRTHSANGLVPCRLISPLAASGSLDIGRWRSGRSIFGHAHNHCNDDDDRRSSRRKIRRRRRTRTAARMKRRRRRRRGGGGGGHQ